MIAEGFYAFGGMFFSQWTRKGTLVRNELSGGGVTIIEETE
jgi:hypothetical protein